MTKKKRLLLVLLMPVFVLAFSVFVCRYILGILFMPSDAWRLAVSFDKFANSVLGGKDNETVSASAGRSCDSSIVACILCKFLDLFDKGHCAKEKEKYDDVSD